MSVKESILAKFQEVVRNIEQPNSNSRVESPTQGKGRSWNGSSIERGKFHGKRRDFHRSPRPKQALHKGLDEKDVGITEFVSPGTGFSGIIKHRFSDFQVREIDPSGNLVIFDSKEVPPVVEQNQPDEEYRSALTDEQWAAIENCANSDAQTYEINVTGMSKDERSRIHKAIKREYGAKLYSNTLNKDDVTMLSVGKCTKNSDRLSWPKNQGRFLHFTLFKENLDTNVLVNTLARQLKLKANHISYAGTKDKRAKTTQRMCVRNRRAERLLDAKIQQAHFGNFEYRHGPLRLGDLWGNEFTLAIRNVEASDEQIEESLSRLRDKAFINYFGLQRFGSSAVAPTYLIGRSLLLEDYEQAVNLILKPRGGEKAFFAVQTACETYWKTKDPIAALKSTGKSIEGTIEGKILGALKKQKDNFCNAIFSLPRNTMLLYLHAYQSLVWNKVVSKRIREFGDKPLAGDLIVIQETAEAVNEADESFDSDDNEDKGSEDEVPEKTRKPVKVRQITPEEVNDVTLFDVVYPLPGKDVVYPDNVIAGWYEEFMKDDGITMDHLKNSNKDFALYGSYRNILARGTDLSWEIVNYDAFDEDLLLSDLDRMQNKTLRTDKGTKFKAVTMRFKLKSSTYATMLLREAMKCDTSVSHQASLTRDTHTESDGEPLAKQAKKDAVG